MAIQAMIATSYVKSNITDHASSTAVTTRGRTCGSAVSKEVRLALDLILARILVFANEQLSRIPCREFKSSHIAICLLQQIQI